MATNDLWLPVMYGGGTSPVLRRVPGLVGFALYGPDALTAERGMVWLRRGRCYAGIINGMGSGLGHPELS